MCSSPGQRSDLKNIGLPQAHVFYETHVDWATVGDELPKKSSTS